MRLKRFLMFFAFLTVILGSLKSYAQTEAEKIWSSKNQKVEEYYISGEYQKAIPYAIEALEHAKKDLGAEHENYRISLNNLALLYNSIGEYSKALPLYLEALENTEKFLGKDHPNYGQRLNNLALLYNEMGEYSKALPLYLEALENTEKTLGKDHHDYGLYLYNLAGLYSSMGEYSKALPLYLEAIENYKFQINQNFTFLTEKGKEDYIKANSIKTEIWKSFFLDYYRQDGRVFAAAFDIELLSKGLILNSNIDLCSRIQNLNDNDLLDKVTQLTELKQAIIKEESKPIANRKKNLEEIKNKAEKLEGEINRKTNLLSEMQQIGKITWKNIQFQLKGKEVAIEFASFRYNNGKNRTDSTLYIALVLAPDYEIPRLVPLFEQKQLDEVIANSFSETDIDTNINKLYTNVKLYELIWKPLEGLIPEGSTIWYAPSGSFHQISLSAIKTPSGQYLSDK